MGSMMSLMMMMMMMMVVVDVNGVAPSSSSSSRSSWSSGGGCREELVAFSECLPYVASPPNNLLAVADDETETPLPSLKCCNSIHLESLCLCHLLRHPNLLGFPLNTTSLLSLSSLCHLSHHLNILCSASPSLPPFTTPTTPTHQDNDDDASSSSAAAGSRGDGGGSSERMEPSGGMEAGTASHFPVLNGAAVAPLTLNNMMILFQILTILFVTVALLNTTQ